MHACAEDHFRRRHHHQVALEEQACSEHSDSAVPSNIHRLHLEEHENNYLNAQKKVYEDFNSFLLVLISIYFVCRDRFFIFQKTGAKHIRFD